MSSFDEIKTLWLDNTKKIKPKKGLENLVFIVVYPNENPVLEWDFASEKQLQTTLLQTSGGDTGSGTGHRQKICYLTELNDVLETCNKYSHAMIVSVGMVFDMTGHKTTIERFYDWTKSKEFCRGHIITKPNKKAFIHQQHIELNLNIWRELGKPNIRKKWDDFVRADDNIHDDYTPSWIKVKGLPVIRNFSNIDRRYKAWSYGHMPERKKLQNKNWKIMNSRGMGWREKIDESDPYFQVLLTRISKIFYAENTETLGKLPDKSFDLIMTPTAGYSGEVFVEKLSFDGEIIFYDYCSENIEIKKNIVEMNMSMDDILLYAKNSDQMISSAHTAARNKEEKKELNERTKTFGTHEELRVLQEKMYNRYSIEYKVWDIISGINIEPTWFVNKIKNKKVFMDISNIFGYHTSHACYSFPYLLESFDKLVDTLERYTEYYHLRGKRPTKNEYVKR